MAGHQTFQNVINGKLVDSASGETYDVIDPTTGEAYGQATAPGASAATRSPWITTARRAGVLGAKRGGDEEQIGAEDLKRRRTAVQMHPISPAAMAGVGRRNSAKTAATRESPKREELGFRERE